ncbi:MAG: HAMP domain-containing histidine kinase [Proteobacteria bacterium]|nr:HAMP domain-containing histidine kinase [Pseudomonadota bacterium]
MSIRKLLLETTIILLVITFSVITINSFQIRHNAAKHFAKLQEEYFDTTYQIYEDEIVGNLLLGDESIEVALFHEIAERRGIGLKLTYKKNQIQAGNFTTITPVKTYEINIGEGQKATLSLYPINDIKNPWIINELVIPLILEGILLSLGFLFLWKRFSKSLLSPLSELVTNLKFGKIETYTPKLEAIQEIKNLNNTLKFMNIEIQKKALMEAEIVAAKQVGHDIRSPLACLILSLSQISELPEERRTLMRSAIQRITDITNSLHSKAQRLDNIEVSNDQIESLMISSLVDSLVSEKRVQLRDKMNIEVNLDLAQSYGLFSRVNSIELKRALSNLINNSVESFDNNSHQINLSVERIGKWIQIKIQDDGKGIPSEILNKIGEQGFSYGKELIPYSGTGLGISHAIKTVESFGGTFLISSNKDKGTTATLELPQSEVPNWFIEKIKLSEIQQVIILDDDQSIYNLWRERFAHFFLKKVNLMHFSCSIQFKDYFLKNLQKKQYKILFLFDYELLNQRATGLDLIEELNITKHAVLVTSYHEDIQIISRCNQIGLRIIPKSIAAFVPIVL